jgi:16S rRNA (cytosine967-C5)-methyltransferase
MMTPSENITARQLALNVLNKFNIELHDVRLLLHRMLNLTTEKTLATELVYGSIRNLYTIDMIIADAADLHLSRIQKDLLNILRIGAYELIFNPQTPEYAAVNEAVKLAHATAGKKQAAFTNAVLRNIVRSIVNRAAQLEDANLRTTIPQSTTIGCRFKNPILPHPKQNPAAYLSKAFSLPEWLVARWLGDFDFDRTRKICLASNRRPSIYIQPNALRISPKDLLDKFVIAKINAYLVPDPYSGPMIKIRTPQQIIKLPGFKKGLFTIQDPTAAKVPKTLSPKPGQTIIDLCAAPGTKTVLMAQLMQNKGTIIATDIDSGRLEMVDQNCQRLGITIVKTVQYDQLMKFLPKLPDIHAVLLDVPCSNTAVLARRPEVRLRLKNQMLTSLTKTQCELLQKAAKIIAQHPNAKICYSTCSIMKDENSLLIQQFLSQNYDFELLSQKMTLPAAQTGDDFDHDGGFVAVLRRK